MSEINKGSFPANERISVDEMLEVGSEGGNGFVAIVRDGTAAGFMLYLVRGDVCFLGFLAVSEGLRSRGIGGEALELLKKRMEGRRVFLNAESPGQEQDERSRRIGFYARHGLVPCGIHSEFAGTGCTVLCTGGLSREEYASIMSVAGTPFRFADRRLDYSDEKWFSLQLREETQTDIKPAERGDIPRTLGRGYIPRSAGFPGLSPRSRTGIGRGPAIARADERWRMTPGGLSSEPLRASGMP